LASRIKKEMVTSENIPADASGLQSGFAAALSQNLFFEMACNNSTRVNANAHKEDS